MSERPARGAVARSRNPDCTSSSVHSRVGFVEMRVRLQVAAVAYTCMGGGCRGRRRTSCVWGALVFALVCTTSRHTHRRASSRASSRAVAGSLDRDLASVALLRAWPALRLLAGPTAQASAVSLRREHGCASFTSSRSALVLHVSAKSPRVDTYSVMNDDPKALN